MSPHLKIKSVANKFELLADMIKGNTDVLMRFTDSNFQKDGYNTPYRSGGNLNGVGIMLFIMDDIPSILPDIENKPVEVMYAELNVHNKKWLIKCSYNPLTFKLLVYH